MAESSLLNVGKKIGLWGAGALAIGGVAAAAMLHEHKRLAKNDPNNIGIGEQVKRGLLDFALGDETADVDLVGFPLKLRELIPNPFYIPAPEPFHTMGRTYEATKDVLKNGGLPNIMQNLYYQDRLSNWYRSRAAGSVKNFQSSIDYGVFNNDNLTYSADANSADVQYTPNSNFAPGTRRNISQGVNADGSLVFGMYNLRR